MTTKNPKVGPSALLGINSYHVTLDRVGNISTIEGVLYVSSVWRGKPIEVCWHIDRYAHSGSALSEWRYGIPANDGYYAYYVSDNTTSGRGDALTTTAISAVAVESSHLVDGWIDSDQHADIREQAVACAIVRLADGRYKPYEDIRQAVGCNADILTEEHSDALLNLAYALEGADQVRDNLTESLHTSTFNPCRRSA